MSINTGTMSPSNSISSSSGKSYISPYLRKKNVVINFKNQELNLKAIGEQLSKLPDDITKLQELLKPLLNNIFINKYKYLNIQSDTTFNIADTTKTNINIYTIPETQEHLDSNKYIAFLKFMIQSLHKNNTEFSTDSDEIITAYCMSDDKDDKVEFEKIKERYKEIYLPKDSEEKYPKWVKDLLKKDRNILYEETEKNLQIKPIIKQTDNEFIDTLKKRVVGLQKCSIDVKEQYDENRKAYFREEYVSEHKILPDEYTTKGKTDIEVKEKIKEVCNNIKWGTDDYKYHKEKNIEEIFESFKKFIVEHANELTFIKTFIPADCFDNNGDIIDAKIKELISNNDRQYKQYIYGYEEDVKDFIKMKQFYEIYNPNDGSEYNCSTLVNWNIILNNYYTKCALFNSNSNETNFPIRFILPDRISNIIGEIDIINNKVKFKSKDDSRNTILIKDIFQDNQTYELQFIGFINIRYYYEDNSQFRNWILFIFKNNNKKEKKNYKLLDYFTGEVSNYVLINYMFQNLNNGSLTKKIAMTYLELVDFIKYIKDNYINMYLYKDEKTLFIRKGAIGKELMQKYELTDYILERNIKYKASGASGASGIVRIKGGGSFNKLSSNITIHLDTYINLFNDKLSNGIFKEYNTLKLSNIIIFIMNKEITNKIFKLLYKYLCVDTKSVIFLQLYKANYYDKYLITKYIPMYKNFYIFNEISIQFKILNNITKNDNILVIDTNMTYIEYIKYSNYKIIHIKFILLSTYDYYLENEKQYLQERYKEKPIYLDIIKQIYDINIIYFKDKIENLLNIDIENINKYKLFIYNNFILSQDFFMYNDFHNVINLYVGMMMSFKYVKIGGTFIIHLGCVAYKHTADIYLILKEYFEESNLYYPEISNLYKDAGIHAIFKNFKGISIIEYNILLNILNNLIKIYPDDLLKSFNIYDKKDRDNFDISKPIDEDENKIEKYITGFLPDDTDYTEIIDFNNSIYPAKLLFLQKVINAYHNPTDVKVPTTDQILSSILYCRKYEIPIFDKYSITSQNSIITKTILHDMYGLHEPIIYKFKTPFSTHIANKIIFNPKFKSTSRTNSTFKQYTSLLKTETISKPKPKSKSKLKSKLNSHSLFNSLFSSDDNNKNTTHKSHSTKHKLSKHKSSTNKLKSTKKHSHFKHSNMSLEESIFISNNQLIQAGRLMDVRKDFSKKYPNELYYNLQNQLRFYQGDKGDGKNKPSDNDRNIGNLDIKVQRHLGDFSISQAWLKMYEIITDCNLIPTNRKGIYKSFHICEAPGTFINCINNYIHTKTNYDSFEWISQSLKPNGARSKANTICDTYGLIKRHHEKWDWGVDGTGDITNIDNIKHYAKNAKNMNVDLMTSDCGLPWGDPKYYQVAYASYVSLLYSLPHNGTLLYKILSPIDIPLIWNLIYITYTNFKEMYFFKPVQNSQSREFYIIGKGYLGTDQKVLDKLLYLVQDFEDPKFNKEEYDLFNDTYPEEFVIQIQHICEKLTTNFVNSIEKIIYYVDNIDALGKDYQKHIESYMEEKNNDWVKKYKPIRLEKKFIL